MPKNRILIKKKTAFKLFIFHLVLIAAIFGALQYEAAKSRRFNIYYTETEHPFIKTSLNNYKDHFILDTGGAFFLKINDQLASNLTDTYFDRIIHSTNINGHQQEQSQYVLEKIEFMKIKFSKIFFIPFKESNIKTNIIDFEKETKFSKNIKSTRHAHNFIGHRLFNGLNMMFDFPKNKFYLYQSDLIPLFKYPYGYLNFFEKIPIKYNYNQGLICTITTEYGTKKFIIDTGSPLTLFTDKTIPCIKNSLNEYPSYHFKVFNIGSTRFKDVAAVLIDKLPFDDIDGILGMDFLYDKVLFVNLKEDYISLR